MMKILKLLKVFSAGVLMLLIILVFFVGFFSGIGFFVGQWEDTHILARICCYLDLIIIPLGLGYLFYL